MRGRRRDEGGQLMLLAGIILTIAFILTSLTLSQVASLEKEAAQEAPTPIIAEWRFLRDRLASNLQTAITPDTTIETYQVTIIPTIAATFRALAAEKGYDIVLRNASGGQFAGTGNEASLISGANYAAWSSNGTVHFTHAAAEDPDNADGAIWQATCPDSSGPTGCISGVLLFLRLADGASSMEESILFAVNRP
jgi:hypothetical protein